MPPLRAAERDIDNRRLPGHEAGERDGVVLVHGRVIAQPALVGAAPVVVLCAIPDVVVDRAVRGLDRELRLHDAVRRQQDRTQLRVEIEEIGGAVEVAVTGLECRRPDYQT